MSCVSHARLLACLPGCRASRDLIYAALLRSMSPEHKFNSAAKLCGEVLAGVADGLLPLCECEEVLRDALCLMACKEIKVSVGWMLFACNCRVVSTKQRKAQTCVVQVGPAVPVSGSSMQSHCPPNPHSHHPMLACRIACVISFVPPETTLPSLPFLLYRSPPAAWPPQRTRSCPAAPSWLVLPPAAPPLLPRPLPRRAASWCLP